MDDKWKGSGYDPEQAWAEVTRPQREEELRKWAEKHDKGSSKLLLWWVALIGAVFVGAIVYVIRSLAQ